MPAPRKLNMRIGTHRGLTLYSLGTGGVYRLVAGGVVRDELALAALLRAAFDFALDERVGAPPLGVTRPPEPAPDEAFFDEGALSPGEAGSPDETARLAGLAGLAMARDGIPAANPEKSAC